MSDLPVKINKHAIFTTLGCKLNQVETSQIARIMEADGIINPDDRNNDQPRLIFINTCCVTSKAAAKSRHVVSRLARENPGAIVIAAGCLAQMDPDSLRKINGVDYILGTASRFSTNWWIGKPEVPIIKVDNDWVARATRCPCFITDESARSYAPTHHIPAIDAAYLVKSRAFLKIQDGCDHHCTFCIIPKLRGPSRSVSHFDVLAVARKLIENGVHEIVLTGVRIGSWGDDIGEKGGLTGLMRDIISLPGDFRIRLGSVEPWELSQELVDLVTSNDKVCPHLHVPFQHTSPRILELMGRPHLSETIGLLMNAKLYRPDLAIGSDIIAGFPGETGADFEQLAVTIQGLPLSYLHVFGFSPRPGTPAENLPDRVSPAIMKERVTRLIEIGKKKKNDFAFSQHGRSLTVIPEHPRADREWTMAVSENYIKVRVRADDTVPGIPLRVKIDSRGDRPVAPTVRIGRSDKNV